ncbi:carbohydrate ABC transporter permease [Blautia stercoris]|jgi:multiple sugar transport system permease protein|uniref:carbohydrate ABC transporter permease n=1 Tax=Blautia stercoris TaxID=871664 RepID=UPI00355C99C4
MKLNMAAKKRREAYIFILPGFIYLVAICGYPLIYNLILSFKNVSVKNLATGASVFVGLDNYKQLFADPTFQLVFKNTIEFTLACLVVQFTIGFLFAMFFSKKFTLAGPIRGLVLVGYMMPMSVTALLGKNLFLLDGGVINDLLMKVHLISSPIDWLVNGGTALGAVIAVNCWVGIPFNMLLLTSGLTGISTDIYESASMDGANAFKRFIYITLPLMKPAMLSVLMLGFIYTFKAFDLMYIMTAGGPFNSTDVLGTYAYSKAFTQYEFSQGSAIAMVLFACLFLVGIFYLKLLSKEDD